MKRHLLDLLKIALSVVLVAAAGTCRAQDDSGVIKIQKETTKLGLTPPIPVSLDGFSGEVADVLKFDLYVQGFSFVSPDAAQYQISGSNDGNVIGRVTDKLAKSMILSRIYTGTSLRRQAHAFANDIVFAITGKKGIGLTKIAFKAQPTGRHRRNLRLRFRRPQPAARHARQRDCCQAVVGAGPAGAVLQFLQAGKPGYFLSATFPPDSAAWWRVLRRLELQPGGLAGRLEGGDDFEQGRQPGCLCRQRRRLEFETADHRRRGLVAVLVAGRAMDLFRDENRTDGGVLAKVPAGGGAIQVIQHHRRAESDRAGLVAGRQMDRVHAADGRV